jgi:hypothetical protein
VSNPENIAGSGTFTPDLCELEESLQGVSLCEVLDRVLNKGVVLSGEIIISVAGVDLVYLGLNLVLTSIDTAQRSGLNGAANNGRTIDAGKVDANGSGRNNAG